MFNLIGKIYVDTERRLNRRNDYITISPVTGYKYLNIDGLNDYVGEQIWFAQNLDDIDSRTLEGLICDAIRRDRTVYIYCDGDTYLRLYTLMIKSVFPSIDMEMFRWMFLCRKATLNTLISTYDNRNDVYSGLTIDSSTVGRYFYRTDIHLEMFRSVFDRHLKDQSLEWKIVRLLVLDEVCDISVILRDILKRIALANNHDLLDVWGRMITDPVHWDVAGADMDTLLDSKTVFAGALNHQFINSLEFMMPGLFDKDWDVDWLIGLLEELIPMLKICDEAATADRSSLVLLLLKDESDWSDPENCKRVVYKMFYGDKRLALPNRDDGKVDENILHFVLRVPVEVLSAAILGDRKCQN